MTKNLIKAVVKPLLKNDFPIIKNCLTKTNLKTKRNFQRKDRILSKQIATQKLPGKLYEDAPL